MTKNTISFVGKEDFLYPIVVTTTLLLISILSWFQFTDGKIYSVWHLPNTIYAPSCLLLALLATCMLVWRISLAWRYKTYAPLDNSKLPVITIVIPAYNEGSQVLATVRSIMASDYPTKKMQVICVDDGSQDDTWQWMLQANRAFPKRVKLIKQPYNAGKRHALMAALRQAKGEIYVTIDSDSEVLPDTLRQLISPFVVDENIGAVAGNVRVLNYSEGVIPKMMEVNFSMSFDFTRSGQSVYGGVLCTPGALSAYRASVINPWLPKWLKQQFMGQAAAIGEDRALSNAVLRSGFRVVYQRDAVVLTKVPVHIKGLSKMLLRWARSNVRENLIMSTYLFGHFRQGQKGEGWVRIFGSLQLFRMVVGDALKVAIVANIFVSPITILTLLGIGCVISSVVPSVQYQVRHKNLNGWRWAFPYAIFSIVFLSWISIWGLLSAFHSGWLTRNLPEGAVKNDALLPLEVSKIFSEKVA
jgi:hyaluronan synthase